MVQILLPQPRSNLYFLSISSLFHFLYPLKTREHQGTLSQLLSLPHVFVTPGLRVCRC